MGKTVFHAASSRGYANHGWLETCHSFSFAGWHNPERIHFGALRVLNDDIVKAGFGFGKHPHDNMEIITIVLEGALEHKDSMGHTQSINPNEVQVMSAGSGIFHSEYNHNKDEDVHLLQIWIFPDKKNITPRYDQRLFDPEERKNKLQTLVSPIDKNDEGLKIHQNAWIYRTNLEAVKSLELTTHDSNQGFYIFVIEGSIDVNEHQLSKRDAIGISEIEKVKLTSKQNSDILILEVPLIA